MDDDCDQALDCADADCCRDALRAKVDLDDGTWASCDSEDTNAETWTRPGEVVGVLAGSDDAVLS